MIPEIEPAIAHGPVKNAGHADRQRGRPAGSTEQSLLADGVRELIHLFDGDRKTECSDPGGGFRRRAFYVHAQVNTGVERAGGDQGHDGHQRFEAHRAVANRAGVTFARDELGCRAAGDQGVKAGDGAASNGDEAEGKQFAGENRTGAIDERCERRHPQVRQHEKNTGHQRENRAQLHERAQIIARRQQQPDRQHAGRKSVEDDRPRQIDFLH